MVKIQRIISSFDMDVWSTISGVSEDIYETEVQIYAGIVQCLARYWKISCRSLADILQRHGEYPPTNNRLMTHRSPRIPGRCLRGVLKIPHQCRVHHRALEKILIGSCTGSRYCCHVSICPVEFAYELAWQTLWLAMQICPISGGFTQLAWQIQSIN